MFPLDQIGKAHCSILIFSNTWNYTAFGFAPNSSLPTFKSKLVSHTKISITNFYPCLSLSAGKKTD